MYEVNAFLKCPGRIYNCRVVVTTGEGDREFGY